jgi:hypothetical protein
MFTKTVEKLGGLDGDVGAERCDEADGDRLPDPGRAVVDEDVLAFSPRSSSLNASG